MPELPAAIMEAMKRQRLEGGGEMLGNCMLGLVERAIEETMKNKG